MERLTCHYCDLELTHKPDRENSRTKDHIVPRARGGRDVKYNWVWCCKLCNVRKADTWPTHNCAKCRRSRRRHWENFGISESVRKRRVD